MVKILSIFVAFLENMNFNSQILLKLVQRQLGLNCKNQLFWVLGFRLVPNGQKPAGFARFGDNNYALFKSATCWSGKKVRTKVFNLSEVHLYRGNFLQNPHFSKRFAESLLQDLKHRHKKLDTLIVKASFLFCTHYTDHSIFVLPTLYISYN